ncbi:MAG: hypothetical protein ACREF7_02705, partial [Candidatus Saccharimonadales bacterium]
MPKSRLNTEKIKNVALGTALIGGLSYLAGLFSAQHFGQSQDDQFDEFENLEQKLSMMLDELKELLET